MFPRRALRSGAKLCSDAPACILIARPATGGIGHVGACCAAYLREAGLNVIEISGPDDGAAALTSLRLVLRHRRNVSTAKVIQIELGSQALSTFWFAVWAAVVRNDLLVVAHDAPLLVKSPGAGLLRKGPGLRDVLAYRLFAPALNNLLARWVTRRSRAVAVLSALAAEKLPVRKTLAIRVVRHGGRATPGTLPPSQGGYVLKLGHIGPQTGLDVLLDAWQIIGSTSPIPLWVVGHVADPLWFDPQRKRATLLSNVNVQPGWVDDFDFASLIANARIVVIPYRSSNPASGILVRAKLQGRAVIASRVEAVVGELDDGKDGLIVDTSDPQALAAALSRLLLDPALCDRLGQAAANRGARDHSWKQHVQDLYGSDLPPMFSSPPLTCLVPLSRDTTASGGGEL